MPLPVPRPRPAQLRMSSPRAHLERLDCQDAAGWAAGISVPKGHQGAWVIGKSGSRQAAVPDGDRAWPVGRCVSERLMGGGRLPAWKLCMWFGTNPSSTGLDGAGLPSVGRRRLCAHAPAAQARVARRLVQGRGLERPGCRSRLAGCTASPSEC